MIQLLFNRCQQEHSKNFSIVFWKTEITTRKKFQTLCWHLRCQRADKLPAGTEANLSLSGTGKKGNRWLWKKWWIKKQRETHLQRKSGRQYMLSAIISMKMQRKPCKKRLTGCWLQKQAERQCNRWGQRQLELRYVWKCDMIWATNC